MCGIAGIVHLQNGRAVDPKTLDRMVDSLHLRGPDDRGVSIRESAGIGMRRLSIIDIEGGHQPMESEDGKIRVVMNGELYSFPEVRSELESLGHRFRTHSDTEILIHGYTRWGLLGLLTLQKIA